MRRMAGLVRIHIASIRNRPRVRARLIRSCVEGASSVNGFSQSTGLPAVRQIVVAAWWAECGVAT